MILTVSRMDAERKWGNPGYRAFLANGFNVTRAFVLFIWEGVIDIMLLPRRRHDATCVPAATAAAATR